MDPPPPYPEQNTSSYICEEHFLSIKEYIDDVGQKFVASSDREYHSTHESSKKNKYIGEIGHCQNWTIPNLIFDLLPTEPCIHPMNSPVEESVEIWKESDGIFYTQHYLISPLLYLLQTMFPHLLFKTDCEADCISMVTDHEGKRIEAKGRVDILISAKPIDSLLDYQIVLSIRT